MPAASSDTSSILYVIGFVIIFLIIIISIVIWYTPLGRDPRFSIWISSIGLVALVVTVVGFFITSYTQQAQVAAATINIQTTLTDRYVINTLKEVRTDPALRRLFYQIDGRDDLASGIVATPEMEAQEDAFMDAFNQSVDNIDLEISEVEYGWDNPEFSGLRRRLQSIYAAPIAQRAYQRYRDRYSPRSRLLIDVLIDNPTAPSIESMLGEERAVKRNLASKGLRYFPTPSEGPADRDIFGKAMRALNLKKITSH